MSALVTALHGPKNRKVSRRAEGLAWIAAGLFGSPPSSRRGSLSSRGFPEAPKSGPRSPDPRPAPAHEPHVPMEIPPDGPTHPPMPEHIPAGDPPQKRELSDRGY
jgi:hypothetical protein